MTMMRAHRREGTRGRGFGSGLVLLLALGCAEAGPGPAGEPVADYRPPTVSEGGEATLVANHGPRETLPLYETLPDRELTLLFLGGRSTTPLASGGSAWADLDGGRLILFDHRGAVTSVMAGGPDGEPPLTRPAFVAAGEDGLLAVEIDGQALAFAGGTPTSWRTPAAGGPLVGGSPDLLAATRTVFDISLVPLRPEEPLLWVVRKGETRGVGRIEMPEQAMLAPVVNSGWVATSPDGSVYFASAVRPEVRRYAADGSLDWTATWPRQGVEEPTFGAVDGTLTPLFRLVQQAVAVGPDGRIYVLATTGPEGPADRLLVFEDDGTFLRAAPVGPEEALYVGPGGHVYRAEAAQALARTDTEVQRVAFEPFDLPPLEPGQPRLRLEDLRGEVLVVNFWASWCAPCRKEMPLLDRYHEELRGAGARVVGINEDVQPAAGRAFLEELGGVGYATGAGEGKMRARYGYRGLPYTVVLDAEGRLAATFYGFGSSIDPIKDAVARELEGR